MSPHPIIDQLTRIPTDTSIKDKYCGVYNKIPRFSTEQMSPHPIIDQLTRIKDK